MGISYLDSAGRAAIQLSKHVSSLRDKLKVFLFVCLFVFAVRGPLTVAASPVVEHRLRTRRLSGHGSQA